MEKRSQNQKSSSTHYSFFEKVLAKFKMTKHNRSVSSKSEVSTDKGETSALQTTKPENSNTQAETGSFSWDYQNISEENLMQFSDQLEQFIIYLQNLKDLTYYTYDYSSVVTKRLEKEATELKNMYRDVRAAAISIETIKKQRQAVKKEKSNIKKQLLRLKEEEVKELESIIQAHAKPLYTKWETMKNVQKPEVLENFLSEIKGKHRATEILQDLICRKLRKLEKKSISLPLTLNNFKFKSSESPVNWNTQGTNDTEEQKVKRQSSKRKKHKEEKNKDITKMFQNSRSAGLDLQLVPIEALATGQTCSTQNEAEKRSTVNSLGSQSQETVATNGEQSSSEGFHNEMRSMIRALFGEIRQLPQITFHSRNTSSETLCHHSTPLPQQPE